MQVPGTTYRLQLSPAFTFEDLKKILDYLEKLQITTIYAAPFFQSREGSQHGYDIINPFMINKAIGNLEEFREIIAQLREKRMTWLQDIVPNHMAYHPSNPWMHSILVQGPQSPYYNYFDINWDYKDWKGKIMAPFLGDSLENALRNGEFKLIFNNKEFLFQYFEHEYPASAPSYSYILSQGSGSFELKEWIEKLKNQADKPEDWDKNKSSFAEYAEKEPDFQEIVEAAVQAINASGGLMKNLLDMQYFHPVPWKVSEKQINFRRFFTINDLICLRMEDEEVFRNYHTFIQQMCEEGLISGLRIDHIDGLADPYRYLENLNQMLGHDFYVIIEKILEWDEELPKEWHTQGTSGYDFLAMVNNLFTASQNKEKFKEGYQNLYPEIPDYEQLIYHKKNYILNQRMGGELQNLWDILISLDLLPEIESSNKGKQALSAFMSAFPVYRIYPEKFPLNDRERKIIDEAHQIAVKNEPDLEKELGLVKGILSGTADKPGQKMLYFLQRCQQFTGPLAAKGVEDTTFYNFNQLISHNEVGDSPRVFGIRTEDFHKLMLERRNSYPLAINASATHDTKRGEDSRMRINALSGMPEEWFQKVEEWHLINKNIRKTENIPDRNEEYFIYQALLGAMPFDGDPEDDFLQRTNEYLEKVLREAKVHSFWSEPDTAYEQEVADFVKNVLENKEFRESFDPFCKKVSFLGVMNSLGQSLIKVTAPGIPDIYQGTELWDLSYVDPDNRRPVDYSLRTKFLNEIESYPDEIDPVLLQQMMTHYADGKIKMFTLFRALRERKINKNIFERGAYTPLWVSEQFNQRVLGFARHSEDDWYLIVIPVGVVSLEAFPLGDAIWEGAYVELPEGAPEEWTDVYTGEAHFTQATLKLEALFSNFPLALLKSAGPKK